MAMDTIARAVAFRALKDVISVRPDADRAAEARDEAIAAKNAAEEAASTAATDAVAGVAAAIKDDADRADAAQSAAEEARDNAAASAATAEAFSGPVYASTAEGLAETALGDFFAVNTGDGVYTIYRHDSGPVATAIRTALTAEVLSSGSPGQGASLIGYATRTVADELGERLPVTRASGIVGNGIADDSDAILDFLENNKGKTIIFPAGRKFLLGNILMSGSSWDGTRLIVEPGCELIAKVKPNGGSTVHGAWAMFAFQGCDDCAFDGRGWLNGNRANQPDSAYNHLLLMAGVEDFDLPSFRVREYIGDGLYVTNENQFSPYGRNSSRLTAGSIYGVNSAPAGRNLVSVISLEDSSFGSVVGVNVGGFVQGGYQPGGFDIEPNHTDQLVSNIVVGTISVTGCGQTMIAVLGRPERTDITKGVVIGQSRSVNLLPATAVDGVGNMTQNGGATLRMRWCEDVVVGDHLGHHESSYGIGVEMVLVTRPKVRARVSHVHTALATSAAGSTLKTIADPDVVVDAHDICRIGHSLTDINGGRISGRLSDPKDSTYYSNRFGVVGTAGGSLVNTVLSVSMTGHANWTRSYRHDGATYTNAVIADCDLSGSAWTGQAQQVGDIQVPRRNAAGVTGMAAKPTGGTWKTGDFVECTVATIATGKVLLGWKRLTDGTGQVLNTDWKEVWGTDA